MKANHNWVKLCQKSELTSQLHPDTDAHQAGCRSWTLWWGAKEPEKFIAVWRHMFSYFSKTKGLDNLLWVYGPNHGQNTAKYYAGDRYVDIVGLDAYTDFVDQQHIKGYEEIAALPKPFGFTEYGPHGSQDPSGNYAREGPQTFGGYFHSKHRDWFYMTLTEGAPRAGLWLSRDKGKTWEAFNEVPFSNIPRVEGPSKIGSAICASASTGRSNEPISRDAALGKNDQSHVLTRGPLHERFDLAEVGPCRRAGSRTARTRSLS